jgi:SAM-dependent methyltransferase
MRQLTPLEQAIYNDGERLIPGVTHDLAEFVRHRSSYIFFQKVIKSDLAIIGKESKPVRIADLGCGVGHGCQTLSEIPGSHVVGVDSFPESLEYARVYYARTNITYQLANLKEFIPAMQEYDYVVSRGVFEHVPNGFHLALSAKWRFRLLFDVPYDEPQGTNPHHVLNGIREEAFSEFDRVELFFQDLEGAIYDTQHKPSRPNMIICVCSHPDLPKVCTSHISFPLRAWQPQQNHFLRNLNFVTAVQWPCRTLQKYLGLVRSLVR